MGSLLVSLCTTFVRASERGTVHTRSNASPMILGLYDRDIRSWRSSSSLTLKSPVSLHILNNRYANEKGMFLVLWCGWHDDGSRYWQRAVSFLYKSVRMNPFSSRDTCMSKHGTLLVFMLYVAVNFMCGCWLLIWVMNSSNSCTVPLQKKKISSINLRHRCGGVPFQFPRSFVTSNHAINRQA